MDREQTSRLLLGLQRESKTLCQPENWRNVRNIADNVNAHSALGAFERVLLDEPPYVRREELVNVLLETLFKEDLVQDIGPFIMLLLLVPSNHKVMIGRTVANRCLVHDNEALTVLKDLLAAFLCLDADDVIVARRTSEVVLVEHLIALKNFFRCFGRVEG